MPIEVTDKTKLFEQLMRANEDKLNSSKTHIRTNIK